MKKNKTSKLKKVEIYRVLLAILIALLITFLIIILISDNPLQAIRSFVLGPLENKRRLGNIVEAAIPLVFSGLATIFLFSTGLYNLSGEGAIFLSGVVATVVSLVLNGNPIFVLIVSIISGALAGMLVTFIPGFLKVKFNASELVTSLMLNYIALNFGLYVIQGPFRDPEVNTMYSYKFPKGVDLGKIITGTRIHYGLILAIIAIFIANHAMKKTTFGYKTRLVGNNENMANYSGINSAKIIIITQLVGGLIAGFGGAVELFGMYDRFQYTELTGYGWDGILIATVAKNNPSMVSIAAIFLAYIRVGASIMSRQTDVPFEIIQIVQAIIIIFISADRLLKKYKSNILQKEINNTVDR